MKTAQEIAQWVIDNRYPKSENDKISDLEMYHEIVEQINRIQMSYQEDDLDEDEDDWGDLDDQDYEDFD